MAFYQVTKAQEALVEYAGVFEAENAYSAYLKATTWKGLFETDWVHNGIINEYDHTEILEDRTELLDAKTFEEAVREIHEAYDFVDLRLTPDQRTIILNALSAWNTGENPLSAMINNLIEEINHA